jgi:hypothetical protein
MANEGREPASFLWAIQREYAQLKDDDSLAFVQGDPYPHCSDLNNMLASYTPDRFLWLGPRAYTTQKEGSPHHAGLPMEACFRAWLGRDWPGNLMFAAGGQFAVPGRMILRHPLYFYRHMFNQSLLENYPWVFERLWEHLFDPNALPEEQPDN